MAAPESRTPHFGLRDFLFYVVPGGVVLLDVLLIFNEVPTLAKDRVGQIVATTCGVLLAYVLGQIAYSATYLLRKIRVKGPGLWEETSPQFLIAYMWAIEKHGTYFLAEIYRYRSFARFCAAMVLPTLFLGGAGAYRLGQLVSAWELGAIVSVKVGLIVGLICATTFVHRYRRYDAEFRKYVRTCWYLPWEEFDHDLVRRKFVPLDREHKLQDEARVVLLSDFEGSR